MTEEYMEKYREEDIGAEIHFIEKKAEQLWINQLPTAFYLSTFFLNSFEIVSDFPFSSVS